MGARITKGRTNALLEAGRTGLVNAESAMKRRYCLVALVIRGQFERNIELVRAKRAHFPSKADAVIEDQRNLISETNAWLKDEGFWGSLSVAEKSLMGRPSETWAGQDKIDASWRTEAVCVIAWCLGLIESMPAYDTEFPAADLSKVADGAFRPVGAEVAAARLRPESEIDRARKVAELWLWRARTTMSQKNPGDYAKTAEMPLGEIVQRAALRAERNGWFKAIDKDFPVFGKAYRELSDREWNMMHSIASERLHALNWICGDYRRGWDRVLCDT